MILPVLKDYTWRKNSIEKSLGIHTSGKSQTKPQVYEQIKSQPQASIRGIEYPLSQG